MAKQCQVCNKPYPENLSVCPHCGAKAGPESGVIDIDWSALDENPESGNLAEKVSLEENPPEVPEVVLGEEGRTMKSNIPSAPRTMLATPEAEDAGAEPPHEHGQKPPVSPHGKPRTMLASPEDLEAAQAEGAASPKAPPPVRGKPETMLARPEDLEETMAESSSSPAHRRPAGETSEAEDEVVELEEPSGKKPRPSQAEPEDAEAISLHDEAIEFAADDSEGGGKKGAGSTPRAGRADEIDWESSALKEAGAKDSSLNIEEEAAAAVDEETAEEEDEPRGRKGSRRAGGEDGDRPAKTVKPRYGRRWLAGTVLGLLLGVIGCVAARVFGGVDVPDKVWQLAGKTKTPATNLAITPPAQPAVPEPTPIEVGADNLDRGNMTKAVQALDKVENPTPDVLAQRGEARWLEYWTKKRQKNEPLNEKDDAVKQAIKDLQAANNAAGTFWLGQIDEALGNTDLAHKKYEQGLAAYPQQQKLFQSAIDRLDSNPERTETKGAEGAQSRLSLPGKPTVGQVQLLALILTALAAEQPKADAPKATQPKTEQPKPEQPAPDQAMPVQPKPEQPKPVPPKPEQPKAEQPVPVPPKADQPKTDQAPTSSPVGEPDEAGFAFWTALRAARNQDYADALTALDQAQKEHAQRRFYRLHLDQNPNSDPTAEIFLRSCDQIREYWKLRQKLGTAGILAKQTSPDQAIDMLLKSQQDSASALKAVTDKLKQEANSDETDVDKLLTQVLDAKKNAEKQLADIQTTLAASNYVTADPKDPLPGLKKLLADNKQAADSLAAARGLLAPDHYVTEDNPSVPDGVKKLLGDKKDADETVAKAMARVELDEGLNDNVAKQLTAAEYLAPTAGKADVPKGVARLIKEGSSPVVSALARVTQQLGGVGRDAGKEVTKAYDVAGRLSTDQAKIIRYQALLEQVRKPQEMLDIWMELLQDPQRKDLAEKAARDADKVIGDTAAKPEVKAKALAVKGLALRNLGQYDEARTLLSQSLPVEPANEPKPAEPKTEAKPEEPKTEVKPVEPGPGPEEAKTGNWRVYARGALKELTDPNAYYLPQAEKLQAAGKQEEALAVLNSGLEVFPTGSPESGRLLAERSVVNLELARSQVEPRLAAADPRVAEIRKDAEAAVAAGAKAEGEYALGRLAEELGDWPTAQSSYDLAMKAHPDEDRSGSQYRLALARVLIKLHDISPAKPPAAAPAPTTADTKTSRLSTSPRAEPVARVPVDLARLAVLITVFLADPGEEAPAAPATPQLDDALKLADQAIQAGDPEGYLIKAKILARKDQWNQALKEYLKGLDKLVKPEYVNGLSELVDNHPAFRMPDALREPDPLLAEKHYNTGLSYYWARRYSDAEDEFSQAVHYNSDDARYLYFLGLARLQLGRRADAYEAFHKGSEQEILGRPTPDAVGLALERVQGPIRKELNRAARRGE